MAADLNFHDYLSTDTNADANTTEVLIDEEIIQLVSVAQEVPEDAENPETADAPVPTIGQVMDAIDLLRHFARAHEGTEDALNVLACYKVSA